MIATCLGLLLKASYGATAISARRNANKPNRMQPPASRVRLAAATSRRASLPRAIRINRPLSACPERHSPLPPLRLFAQVGLAGEDDLDASDAYLQS